MSDTPNPFIKSGKPLDYENTIYPQLGITKAEDRKKFEDYIEKHKAVLKPPDLGDDILPDKYEGYDNMEYNI